MARKPPEFVAHPMPFPTPQLYRAFCRYVVDGDTQDFLVDLGVNHYAYLTVRIRGWDAPELAGPERPRGLEAKALLQRLVLGQPVRLRTYKDPETFGRYLADVEFWDGVAWRDVVAAARAAGF